MSKRRPYRLKFRPVRRPLELNLKFDFNLKPSVSSWFKQDFKPVVVGLPPIYEPRPITAADVARVAETIRPVAAAMRQVAQAFRVAPLLSLPYLEKLREAMNKDAEEQKRQAQAWLDEATRISHKKYLEQRREYGLIIEPLQPTFLVSGWY